MKSLLLVPTLIQGKTLFLWVLAAWALKEARGTPQEMQHSIILGCSSSAKWAHSHVAPWWQQEPEGPAEPPLAGTSLMVGVMSVLFSEVLTDSAIPVPPCWQWARVPLLLPQGTRAGPTRGQIANKGGSNRIWKGQAASNSHPLPINMPCKGKWC